MIPKSAVTVIESGIVFCALGLFLFADGLANSAGGFGVSIFSEVAALCRDASIQWMLVCCLSSYFVVFLILEQRSGAPCLRLTSPNIWLAALVAVTLLPYALAYATAAHSLQILVLLTGVIFGKALATWTRWRNNESQRRATIIIGSLVGLLAAAALWQPETSMVFQYHGIARWVGVWDNPNLYGLLMGVGTILSFGFLVSSWRRCGWWLLPCMVATGLCGLGLFKSYSRGAWLAVLVALIYLAVQIAQSSSFAIWFRRHRFTLILLVTALSLLAFWQFRFSESRPAQRIFSVANPNDFSWRNRVTAWTGAAQMMADQPLTGFGWGQAETEYGKKYCPLSESAAIQLNDYLMIGISAGVPAMVCFAAYLGLSVRRKILAPIPHPPFAIFTTARAGAIGLLIGFWFDGGLFKLPVAIVFWTLMELSRIELPAGDAGASLTSKIASPQDPPVGGFSSKLETWFHRIAWALAVLAFLQTVVYLATPFFLVNQGTLAVARKCLIRRSEAEDFEWLSTNTNWRAQKLKALLDHVRLAHYNRQLVNWKLDDKIYQDFVLSPVITGAAGEELNWRRPLWEDLYPRIRQETSPTEAARIVRQRLREYASSTAPHILQNQKADAMGFQIIFVAALRSVGVPARINANRQAEFYDGNVWHPTPTDF